MMDQTDALKRSEYRCRSSAPLFDLHRGDDGGFWTGPVSRDTDP